MKSFTCVSFFAVLIFTLSAFTIQDAHATTMTFTTNTIITKDQTIAAGETWTVDPSVVLTINSGVTITVQTGGILTNLGTINTTCGAGTAFACAISVITNSGGTISNSGIINLLESTITNSGGNLTNSGTINSLSGGSRSNLINSGNLTNSGTINNNGYFTNNSGGTITISGTIDNSDGIIINSGTITNSGGTIFNISGSPSFIDNSGTITNSGTINNNGSFTLITNSGFINNLCGGIINNAGTLTGNPIIYSTCNLVFTSGTGQTLTANQISSPITVQLQHTSGTPVNAGTGGVLVNLVSTSVGGQFSLLSSPFTSTSAITIPAGSNSATFYYKDTTSGSPTITASSGTLTSATTIFTVTSSDTIPPDTIITSNPSSLTTSSGATFTFTGSDDTTLASNLVFQCSIDGGTFAPCTNPVIYSGLTTGSHSFQVRSVDQAGNTDLTPASFTWAIINLTTSTTTSCGTMAVTTDASGNTIITGTDSSGIITVKISLPPGTAVPSGTIDAQCNNGGANKIAQVSGVVVPYPPGKSVTVPSGVGKFACIDDSPSIVNPTCSNTNTANSIVKMDCTVNGVGNPVTQTFSGFPDAPATRTYTCTQINIGGNPYTKIDGLAFSTIIIDNTPPTITFAGSINNGDSFLFGSVPAAPTCSATDDLSGIDGTCTITGYSSTLGDHTLTGTARDGFGNVGTTTLTYHVLPWIIKGFYQPVDMSSIVNTIKNGQTVPMKFNIYKGTTSLTDPSVATFSQKQVSCITGEVMGNLAMTTTGNTSLRYDATSNQFVLNWQSPKISGNCYDVTVTTLDGSYITAHFKLK